MIKKVILLFLVLDLFMMPLFAQDDMSIEFIGHSTMYIEGEVNILIDPFFQDGILGFIKRRLPPSKQPEQLGKVDIVLITHTHPDHCDRKAIKKLKGNPILIIPWNRKGDFKGFTNPILEMRPWEEIQHKGTMITAVPAKHMLGNCLGYIVEADQKRLYFTGDTKIFSGTEKIKDIDIMFLPYGGTKYIGSIWTPEEAVSVVKQISPGLCIPVHWGTMKRWWTKKEPQPPVDFCEKVTAGNKTKCRILETGKSLVLD